MVKKREYGVPERSVMIALMASNREVANAELKRTFKLNLEKEQRERLNRDGLVSSRKSGNRGYFHTLTDDGWKWVAKELDAPVPPKAGSAGGALYAFMNGLGAALSSRRMTLKELMSGKQVEPSLPKRIRRAYQELANGPRDWVELRDLRSRLGDANKTEVDDALKRMFLDKEINLTLHEDQGALTQADRDAAVRLGPNDMHLISIEYE